VPTMGQFYVRVGGRDRGSSCCTASVTLATCGRRLPQWLVQRSHGNRARSARMGLSAHPDTGTRRRTRRRYRRRHGRTQGAEGRSRQPTTRQHGGYALAGEYPAGLRAGRNRRLPPRTAIGTRSLQPHAWHFNFRGPMRAAGAGRERSYPTVSGTSCRRTRTDR